MKFGLGYLAPRGGGVGGRREDLKTENLPFLSRFTLGDHVKSLRKGQGTSRDGLSLHSLTNGG